MRLARHELGKEGLGQVLQHFGNRLKGLGFIVIAISCCWAERHFALQK